MVRRLIVVACLSSVALAQAERPRTDRIESALSAADADLARGDAIRAERRLLAALARKPSSTRLLLRYAELALPCELEPSEVKAAELVRRLARAATVPSDASAVPDMEGERRLALHAAHAHAALGDLGAALDALRAATQRQDPTSASCARSVAARAVASEQLTVASEALQLAREAMPQDPALVSALARVWLARGRVDQALPLLAERFAIAGGELGARRELAYALAADGRPDEALDLLRAARAPCEQDAACALLAARVALEAGRLDEATSYLRARLATDAEDVDALFVLADVSTRAHRLDDARSAYQRVLRLRPDSVRAREGLAAIEPSAP
jgi:tetratricopeptide (TPR) repeat protein